MLPNDFARALKHEVPNSMQHLPNIKLSLLVHYLVQEELGMVSFDKLHRALNLTDRDQPLRQDKLDEIHAVKKEIKQ